VPRVRNSTARHALAGLAITIVLMYQQPPPGIEAEAEGRLYVSVAIVAVQSELAILIVIGVGMMGGVTERSFIDLAVGTAVLANFGSATVAIAEQVRHLEHLLRVRYHCLAISPRSWRMVWTRQ
jgi:hypothetical protein